VEGAYLVRDPSLFVLYNFIGINHNVVGLSWWIIMSLKKCVMSSEKI
jgi:hypothetical protein